MPTKDKLDLSNKNRLDLLVDYRWFLVIVVIVISLGLAVSLPRLQTDPTLKSGVDQTSDAYKQHQEFVRLFGHEEFLLIALKSDKTADDPQRLESLTRITKKLEGMDKLAEVISLANLRVFQEKDGRFGSYPVLRSHNDVLSLPEKSRLETVKKALPIMDFLVSPDLTTLGVLVRIDDRWWMDTPVVKSLIAEIQTLVQRDIPAGTDFRMVGAAMVRQAIVRYNIQTGIIFGILCMLIGTLVTAYVFKSWRVTGVANVILMICVLWVLGLMVLFDIPLNSTTALSFGFIPIVTVEIVIHMVIRYHLFHQSTRDKIGALKQSVRWLTRPCFICSSTTAVGFGTLMVSSIPMVRQLGFIMGLGIIISWALAMILTPAFFSVLKSLDAPEDSGIFQDWLSVILGKLENAIFAHHRLFVALGVGITVLLFAGAPMIRSDPQILRMLSARTPEVTDITMVEENLTPVNSLELMLEAEDHAFRKAEVWKKVAELESRLKGIPEVVTTDSLLPLLDYLYQTVEGAPEKQKDLFANPDLIPQLLVLTSLGGDGERVARRYVNAEFDRLHISVRIRNSPTVPIGNTIDAIRSAAESVMQDSAKVVVTGDLAVVSMQAAALITDQIRSMFLAVALITILMMIQMGSVLLGLICLIPNIPPVAAVFGIMGWFGISLDSVTVFAATVAIGLAVDNTIHFLTQLRREIEVQAEVSTAACVRHAYRLTSKQILSWSMVTLMGFLALAVSPFRPVVFFGILGCSSIVLGIYGDLIFLQSLILTSSTIRNTIRGIMQRQRAAQDDGSR
jgi:uncharacterized protein